MPRSPRHPFKTAGLALLVVLFAPLALFIGMWLAPVVLIFTPLYLYRGAELANENRPPVPKTY